MMASACVVTDCGGSLSMQAEQEGQQQKRETEDDSEIALCWPQ